MKLLAVDPGIGGTGIAYWATTLRRKSQAPDEAFNIWPREHKTAYQKAKELFRTILRTLDQYGFDKGDLCVHESPEFYSVGKGRVSAASGDLVKLSYACAAVAFACEYARVLSKPYEPSKWKGNMSKQQVERRIKLLVPDIWKLSPKSHSWDAIGIGLWHLGVFK